MWLSAMLHIHIWHCIAAILVLFHAKCLLGVCIDTSIKIQLLFADGDDDPRLG